MKIVATNVFAQLQDCDSETLKIVRHHVSYRKQKMPPVEAQKIIKGFFSGKPRWGTLADLSRLWASSARDRLLDLGVTEDSLTKSQLETTLRQRGVWDGWVGMVNAAGWFLTGLIPHVERAITLRAGKLPPIIEDTRGDPPFGDPWDFPSLFTFQHEAVESFLEAGRGVVNLPPRSGKTRVAIAAISKIGLPTLYIAPTVGLVNQTVEAISDLLGHEYVRGATGGVSSAKKGRQLSSAPIVVSTPQTAVKIPGVVGRKVLVIDEFHHSAAKTWQAVSAALPHAYWRLGLTGTHFRADGLDMEMAGVLSRAVYQRSVGEMVEIGRLAPARIVMVRVRWPEVTGSGSELYSNGIVNHVRRNDIAVAAIKQLVEQGKRVLVLAKEIAHTKHIASRIPGAAQVDGTDNGAVDQALKWLQDGAVSVVVGTSVIGEGRDVPAADALVYLVGGKSRVRVTQDYFRVLTSSPGKQFGIVVDFADCQHERLSEWSAARLRIYRAEPAFKVEVLEEESLGAWLGDNGK